MKLTLLLLLRLGLFLLVAPLLPGLINRIKAWVAGRRGPPLFQLYYDLHKLWGKGVVRSHLASPGFLLAPAAAWTALFVASLLLPLGPAGAPFAFHGDMILLIYLLSLSRFCTAWGALETGSAFEGMGSVRELSYAILAELAMITALLSLCVQSSSITLVSMLAPAAGPGAALLAAGLFTILLLENCRVPFDDPNTHLELTMVHEAMILDHSGPPLAVILHGASLKLLLFSLLLIQAVLPLDAFPGWQGALALLLGVGVVTLAIGLVESLLARLAFKKVPLLLTTALLLCVFALLVAWQGLHT